MDGARGQEMISHTRLACNDVICIIGVTTCRSHGEFGGLVVIVSLALAMAAAMRCLVGFDKAAMVAVVLPNA